jgi:hypothetical protein
MPGSSLCCGKSKWRSARKARRSYQTLALGKALLQLHRSLRVYKDDHTLVDPLTGEEWPLPLPGPCSRTAVASLPS